MGPPPWPGRLADRFAALCDLAAAHGLAVDLEIMPWRHVGTLDAARAVVEAAGRENGGVLIDALHLSRSGGDPADVARLPPGYVRHAQLCDAVLARPSNADALIAEARCDRLLPGDGALPLLDLLAALPEGTSLSVEVPNGGGLSPEFHVRRAYDAARRVLTSANTSAPHVALKTIP